MNNKPFKEIKDTAGPSSVSKNTGKANRQGVNTDSKVNIWSREDEYRRLNAELEARTAGLVAEAEALLRREKFSTLLLDRVDQDVISCDEADVMPSCNDNYSLSNNYNSDDGRLIEHHDTQNINTNNQELSCTIRNVSNSHKSPSINNNRIASARPNSATKPSKVAMQPRNSKRINKEPTPRSERNVSNYVASKHSGLLSKGIGNTDYASDFVDDMLPAVAMEMGADAQTRLLRATLRVTQEELDRVTAELNQAEADLKHSRATVKQVEEENCKLKKQMSSEVAQVDRYRKIAEEAKVKVESLQRELETQRREGEALKRDHTKQTAAEKTAEIRLTRATEEIDRLKTEIARLKSSSSAAAAAGWVGSTATAEELRAENKKLEKQRQELIAAFKKQLRLIDILKREKLHLESARLIQFTEQEFIRALECENK